MRRLHWSFKTIAVLSAALMTMMAAHAQPAKKGAAPAVFAPEVGQAGKDVIWVPTGLALVNKMLDMAKLTPKDYLIDLGSGDGRTVITAAKRGARAHGIEYNPDMVVLSKRNAAKEGIVERATFEKADIFESDFSKATVITLFLLPSLNVKLRPILLNMRAGTRIASNSFDMGDWKPDQTTRLESDCDSWCTAHFWIVPAKVDGRWKVGDDELTFSQQYQMISGTLRSGGNTQFVSAARLEGEQIYFSAGTTQYSGHVNGDTIDGISNTGTAKSPWQATRVR